LPNLKHLLDEELDNTGGVLRLKPAFVARTFYPGLGRLRVKKYYLGKRGWLCERWIASSVLADNPIPLANEGLSFIAFSNAKAKLSLKEALELNPARMLGENYAREHGNRFGVLTKILDIGSPIPWHIHAREEDAKKYWGMKPKEEAYYFLDSPEKGPFPYSHIAVHPFVTPEDLLPILRRWNDDKVLDLSPAYRLNIGEGFHTFPGVPHAPGTALTLEVQEESDVYNMLQAFCNGEMLSKDLMLRGLPNEQAVSNLIDWARSTDPNYYKKHHTTPEKVDESQKKGDGFEKWIFNPNRSSKFSGKELTVSPGKTFESRENGAYVILAWKGRGKIGETKIQAGNILMDELFFAAEAAVEPHAIMNTGKEHLVLYKIFGPNVNKAHIIYGRL